MATSAPLPPNAEELIRVIESHHEQYVANLRLLFGNSTHRRGSSGSGSAAPRAPSPIVRAITFQPDPVPGPGSRRVRRFTNELQDQRRASGQGSERRPRPPSTNDGDSDSDNGGDTFLPLTPARTFSERVPEPPMTYVRNTLNSEVFTEQQLADHLNSLDEAPEATVRALDDVWVKRADINPDNVLSSFEPEDDSPYLHATYEVYEVGSDGLADHMNSRHGDEDGGYLDISTVWDTISKVNQRGDAVGRMTILQEPSPLMLGAAHMTMKNHFDMDELLQHLVSKDGNKGKTRAYMNRAFETEPIRQRSFFFVFKYYTILGDGLLPAPWQYYDSRPLDRRSPDHIDIVECSSVLALSLEGDSTRTISQRIRKGGKFVSQKGHLYDPSASWHLLNIQCFPDQIHSVRDGLTDPFFNGPYAFLDCLGMEYKDAVKRYTQLYEMITKLITPSNQFMFDSKLRDKLLFEDAHFTYSRRYFWAYNTLGVINDGIKSMCKAYSDAFTKDFWAGRHRTLWPHPDPDSADGVEYAMRMRTLQQELESAVADLEEVHKKNERTRTEIRSLREQLFSGSSVKESRRAIEQGDNIKVLTGLSMIFLPLTFVTGVFSITTVDIPTNDWRFAVTTVAVCVPFFFLIFILQTRVGMDAVKRLGQLLRPLIFGNPNTNRAGGSGGAEAGGVKKKKFFGKAQRPVIRRTQSTLGSHHNNINRRGTGTASLAGERSGVAWSRMRPRMRWGGGEGGGGRGIEPKGPGWTPWWRQRHKAEEGVSTEKDSNV